MKQKYITPLDVLVTPSDVKAMVSAMPFFKDKKCLVVRYDLADEWYYNCVKPSLIETTVDREDYDCIVICKSVLHQSELTTVFRETFNNIVALSGCSATSINKLHETPVYIVTGIYYYYKTYTNSNLHDKYTVIDGVVDLTDGTNNIHVPIISNILYDETEYTLPVVGTTADPCNLVTTMISLVGDAPSRPGLVDTPRRVVRMWKELYEGYDPAAAPTVTTFKMEEEGFSDNSNIIYDSGVAWSQCEHHTAPFKIEYVFAYIPNPKGKLLGLSKISRVVKYCAHKLQLQERLGSDVLDMLYKALMSDGFEEYPPLGMGIMMKGAHSCKVMRGVKSPGSMFTITTRGKLNETPLQDKFVESGHAILGNSPVEFS